MEQRPKLKSKKYAVYFWQTPVGQVVVEPPDGLDITDVPSHLAKIIEQIWVRLIEVGWKRPGIVEPMCVPPELRVAVLISELARYDIDLI